MRILEGHKVNGTNEQITITVLDEPSIDGACHAYELGGIDSSLNPSMPRISGHRLVQRAIVLFQNGFIPEAGVNGVTIEALLVILIDRLEGFQHGKYASQHNEDALKFLQAALTSLQTRTRERLARGVEGTSEI